VSLSVDPSPLTLPHLSTLQLAATGHLTDGTTADLTTSVTWTTSVATRLTIDPTGLATAKTSIGAVNVTATLGTVKVTVPATVT